MTPTPVLEQVGFLFVYFFCSVGVFTTGYCAWQGFKLLRRKLAEIEARDAEAGGAK